MSKSLKKLIDINRLREFKNKLVGAGSAYVQTAAVDQTVAGTKTFSKPIVGSVTGSSGSCTGNAATATQFSANATVALTGDATGTSAGSKKGWSVPVTLANSGVTAGTYGPSADVTGNNNATISVPEITVDAKGRVTSVVNRTLTCKNNTYTVNNATLTIQKNGTTVKTFTANASANVTANITVPTKVSELTNDSGFLTSHSPVDSSLSSTSINAIQNKVVNAALNNKANDSDVVHKSDDETVAGTKTFSKPIVGSVTGSSGSCTGNAASATKLATARSLWGNNFDGSAAITGAITGTPAIEFKPAATTANHGGFLDFHYNQSTADYTSRIIESASGTLSINNVTITTGKVVTATTFNGALTGNVTGNCSGSSGSCTGNAATATKLAAKRTIALSGAATGTATGFDGSGNITIPVTALSGSAITSAITIYDLVPDGAANHRNFYRGKDLTAAFNAGTVSEHIADGTFRDIFPGDYITKQITVPQILKADGTTEYIAQKTYTVNFVIADLDIWLTRGDTATTAHHVAIVPQSIVFNSCMNETNTTEGGYLGSFMNTNVMPAFATGLQGAFGASHLISFRIGLSNGVTTTTASASHPYWTGTSNWWGAWTSEICCLMSEGMVYGQSPNHSAAMDETMCGQFAAFRLNSNLVYNRQTCWLSDVVSSAFFARVGGNGSADATHASSVNGARPFALLV